MVSWGDIRREPFRLFFPLAILCGLVGVGQWLAYAAGGASVSGFTHAWIQMMLYMSCFIAGFLLTAIPRFATSFPASTAELAAALAFLGGQWLSALRQSWAAAGVCFVGFLGVLALFAGRRFASRRAAQVQPPVDFVWIPVALLHGVTGTGLLLAGQAAPGFSWALAVGRPMASQGFVLGMVVGVAGFLAPRLMGHFSAAFIAAPPGAGGPPQDRLRGRRLLLHGIGGALFFASFWIEGAGAVRIAYLLRAAVVTAQMVRTTQCHRLPRTEAQYVRLLWAALWMVQLGLWGAGLFPRYRVGMLHLTFLGGLSLMTFAIGTMVVFSHTGQRERLQRLSWVLRLVGAGIAVSAVARWAADWKAEWFFLLLGIASISWMLSALIWLVWILPFVMKAAPSETFERMHEAAKAELLRPSRPKP